ncbi:MAG: NmrA/HSCARG family protein [Chromatiales bacterium]|nr:NmrA/HSCARG family protein [Chromatiales bacterium]
MATKLTVLVSGATGSQGGAVTQALLASGHTVRALTRNTESPSAKRLLDLGAEVVRGNFDDAESFSKAMEGIDSFYLMGSPLEVGVGGETRQGIALANAAKAADVGHLVYGSVANADQSTDIPHFDSKYTVEQHIKMLGIPYTVSAPVFFMDNVVAPWSLDALKAGKISQALPGDRKLQQVSVKNIGDFVASLINRREAVFGKRFDIAGDELTGEESAAILTKVTGREIRYESLPVSALREQSEDMAMMYEWFDRVGYSVNIAELHKTFSDVDWQSYTQWVESQSWQFLHDE